jgi:predicted ester cyclase
MSSEQNKAIVRRFVEEGINQSNETVFLDLLAPDVVDHYAMPGLPPGREGWNLNRKLLRAAFPDAVWAEEDMIAEGDRVVGRYILRGTHQGEFLGIAPTGAKIVVSNIHMCRIKDGKIVEHWGHGDDLGMMQQLGALPAPELVAA